MNQHSVEATREPFGSMKCAPSKTLTQSYYETRSTQQNAKQHHRQWRFSICFFCVSICSSHSIGWEFTIFIYLTWRVFMLSKLDNCNWNYCRVLSHYKSACLLHKNVVINSQQFICRVANSFSRFHFECDKNLNTKTIGDGNSVDVDIFIREIIIRTDQTSDKNSDGLFFTF